MGRIRCLVIIIWNIYVFTVIMHDDYCFSRAHILKENSFVSENVFKKNVSNVVPSQAPYDHSKILHT